jgi:hypothetical protein
VARALEWVSLPTMHVYAEDQCAWEISPDKGLSRRLTSQLSSWVDHGSRERIVSTVHLGSCPIGHLSGEGAWRFLMMRPVEWLPLQASGMLSDVEPAFVNLERHRSCLRHKELDALGIATEWWRRADSWYGLGLRR